MHYGRTASRLAEDRDVLRVAAEVGDVPLYPFDAEALVKQAVVRRRIGVLRGDLGMAQEAEAVEAVSDGYQDHAAGGDALAVELLLMGIAFPVSASEYPHHYGKLIVHRLGRCPDVGSQAVLSHGDFRVNVPLFGVERFGVFAGGILVRDRSELRAQTDSVPVFCGLRGTPAVLAGGICRKGYALVDGDARVGADHASHASVLGSGFSQHVTVPSFTYLVWN